MQKICHYCAKVITIKKQKAFTCLNMHETKLRIKFKNSTKQLCKCLVNYKSPLR